MDALRQGIKIWSGEDDGQGWNWGEFGQAMGFGGLFGLFGGYQTARDVMSVGGLLLGGVNAAQSARRGIRRRRCLI